MATFPAHMPIRHKRGTQWTGRRVDSGRMRD
jgi:hypothetical protein